MIFPAALAVAQDLNASGEEFIAACVVGYEVGCRVGEYLGKSHYEVCMFPCRYNHIPCIQVINVYRRNSTVLLQEEWLVLQLPCLISSN